MKASSSTSSRRTDPTSVQKEIYAKNDRSNLKCLKKGIIFERLNRSK